ncbi:MAG: LD-carboxypeptidase [Bacilli bacterium]|nr:LD-carboxypeptidase [Bacilli bacterium]
MMQPKSLKKGDKVAIVSLSRGLLGMPFCKHELDLGIKRLEEMGLIPVIMDNALKDMDYLEAHPEARAHDLKQAFMDPEIKGIINAIGGFDTYKTIPYLMEDEEFIEAVKKNPKIFTGFSDTTNNHLMLNRLGLSTFYGPCLLVDIAELDSEMLPYTKKYFDYYFEALDKMEITSSPVWYMDRKSYGVDELGKPREMVKETHGFEILNGEGKRTGKLYGGCIESIYEAYVGGRYEEAAAVYQKYNILPSDDEWKKKILFLETSDEKSTPEKLEEMLSYFKKKNILSLVQGVIFGKPIDEVYYEEYKQVISKVFEDIDTPVLYNVNFGHSVPRCIIPYDAKTIVDYGNKTITVDTKILSED